jgi:hypothetical protein
MTYNDLMAEEAERVLLGLPPFDIGVVNMIQRQRTIMNIFYADLKSINIIKRRQMKKRDNKDNEERRKRFSHSVIDLFEELRKDGAVVSYSVFETIAGKWHDGFAPEHKIVAFWKSIFSEEQSKHEVIWNDVWPP